MEKNGRPPMDKQADESTRPSSPADWKERNPLQKAAESDELIEKLGTKKRDE